MSKPYVTDCDYCGEISLCQDDGAGGKTCSSCKRYEEEKSLAIEFTGTFFIVAKDVKFQPLSWITGNVEEPIINGEDWLKLSKKDRQKYILQSISHVVRDCQDMNTESLKITEEED